VTFPKTPQTCRPELREESLLVLAEILREIPRAENIGPRKDSECGAALTCR
jgi:hypothetical protein